jgi:uncharacterized protein (TIGR03435 family)
MTSTLIRLGASTALIVLIPASSDNRARDLAQGGTSGPAFEVASVKPSRSEDTPFFTTRRQGALVFTGQELRTIIALAYGIDLRVARFRLVGGPNSVLSARFDITGKSPDDAAPGQHMVMLKSLLEERFKLRTHTESRDTPIYAVTVARDGKLGPSLQRSTHDCAAFIAAGGRMTDRDVPRDTRNQSLCWGTYGFWDAGPGTQSMRYAGPIATLVERLQPFLDRPVVDATGLAGNFEWALTFLRDTRVDSEYPQLFMALEEQLGLKLAARKGPVDVIVIDSVQLPTPD